VKTQESVCRRSVALWVCLVGVGVLLLGIALAGCSFSSTTAPTNDNPLSLLRNDILAAGITPVEGSQVGQDELYLKVLPVEGQDPSLTADTLLSLAQKYRKQLHVGRLHVVISPIYDHTFDLDASPTSTA
jgi:hypothetical protein